MHWVQGFSKNMCLKPLTSNTKNSKQLTHAGIAVNVGVNEMWFHWFGQFIICANVVFDFQENKIVKYYQFSPN